jgi:hypothetical protein
MTARSKFYIPSKGTAARLAAEHLFKTGPAPELELYAAVDFKCAPEKRAEKLQRAVSTGVLTQLPDGKLDCTKAIRTYFEDQACQKEEAKPIGEITPAQYRPNIFASQGISKKNIPNRRGLRPASDLAPAWSVRETLSIKTIAGGEA